MSKSLEHNPAGTSHGAPTSELLNLEALQQCVWYESCAQDHSIREDTHFMWNRVRNVKGRLWTGLHYTQMEEERATQHIFGHIFS